MSDPQIRIRPPDTQKTVRVRALVSFASADSTFGRRLEYDIPANLAAVYLAGDLVERVSHRRRSK